MWKMNWNQRSGETKLVVMEASAELCPRQPEIWSAFSGGSVTGKAETGAGGVLKNNWVETIIPHDVFR